MKKSLISLLVILIAVFLMNSCTTKQSAINQLENFSYELRDNGRYYNIRDWENAAERFSDIRKKINKHDYTAEQRHRIGELEGQCAGYVYEGIKGRIQDFGSEVNGLIEGLMEVVGLKF